MLTKQENERLTRVGKGTPMGTLLRQYWIPALLSSELETDGKPMRVRLLGEDLVAYRDSGGRVGMLGELCPHRGASLYFGRNEERGLRCVYHGWKFDVTGSCIDMPNERPETDFRHKIKHTAYRCEEAGGVIWTYMGDAATPPPLPKLEWTIVPESHRLVTKRYQECNWVQGLEGGVDSSHISFLHTPLDPEDSAEWAEVVRATIKLRLKDKAPHFEVVDTDYGVMIGARRSADEGHYYWRISQFLMPFYNMVPPGGKDPHCPGKFWVPIDDENTMNWSVQWHPSRPLRDDEREEIISGIGAHFVDYLPEEAKAYGNVLPVANKGNDYLIDWEKQRIKNFSGIRGVGMQDQAMQDSQGIIYDRSAEHLGSADLAVLRTRRRLMSAERDLREKGITPPGLIDPDVYMVRGMGLILPKDVSWVEGSRDTVVARPGVNYASV